MTGNLNTSDIYELAHKLDERVKELNCLYGISRLAEDRRISLDDLLQKIIELVPLSWQYPEITCARILLSDREFATPGFEKTPWKQSEDISVSGAHFGSIEVYYRKEMPPCGEGPFLKEERLLIRAVAERLGQIVERYLAEVNLEKLYEEEKRLRERLQAEIQWRIDYTRGLIHELKTPLTSLLATSQLLLEEEKDERLARLARYVCEGAGHLNSRIDELHDIIRGEMGNIEFNPEPLDIASLLKGLEGEIAPLAGQYEMKVEISLPDSLPPVYADPVRVRQIMLNLLNNAVKYASEGGRVIVTARPGKSFLTVEVRDFGPGMAGLDAAQLFSPGYRMVQHEKRSGGLGIGLSLCKVLVGLHGGKIWVNTRRKKGGSILFTLPLVKSGSVLKNTRG